MDPHACRDLLEAALERGDVREAAHHAADLSTWLANGGYHPDFPPGRYEGCPWWVLYLQFWTGGGVGEVVSDDDGTGRNSHVVLHKSSIESRILFDEPEAAAFIHEVDQYGFHHAYPLTKEEEQEIRNTIGG